MKIRQLFSSYINSLNSVLTEERAIEIDHLAQSLLRSWREKRGVFLCGNGGSAANAAHLVNDFIYGIDTEFGNGLRVEALSSNSSVITCLANDQGYESIFSQQLTVKADPGDMLIVLSGSGNSPNIIRALEVGNQIGMRTFAILGFSGGYSKELAQRVVHFPIDDMQIAEDLQLIVGHICMQWLCEKNSQKNSE